MSGSGGGSGVGVIILAAGASARMGRPKLLLPWGDTTILGHQIAGWRSLEVERVVVVHSGDSAALGALATPDVPENVTLEEEWGDSIGKASALAASLSSPGARAQLNSSVVAELDRLTRQGLDAERIVNPDPMRGMFSSIQTAARRIGADRGAAVRRWVLSLGDQPQVRWGTWRELLLEANARPEWICQPSRGGRARHPVVIPAELFFQIAAAPGPTLKDFLSGHQGRRYVFESDDAGLDFDLDYPDDYRRARQWAEGGATGDRGAKE